MTNEEKQLLVKDLTARLPYGVKLNCFDVPRVLHSISIDDGFITVDCGGEHFYYPFSNILHKDVKPYLRSIDKRSIQCGRWDTLDKVISNISYLLENHYDINGLIPMGLALEAPEGMYD